MKRTKTAVSRLSTLVPLTSHPLKQHQLTSTDLAAIIPADQLNPARVKPFPVPSELHPASEAAFTSLWTTSGRWRSLINIDFLTPNAM